MPSPAITAHRLGKCYRMAGRREDSLRDTLAATARRLLHRPAPEGKPAPGGHPFWAIRDLSFEVEAGDVVGIVGRNGAGKSTLLKILSQVTEPTEGEVRLRGRVSTLLEVGTGFHPELSGRENIFLNGAILGMKRAEIRDNFQRIVDFSELAPFLDTPVKRYSSGMYVRLAFSVAAHLQSDILFLDEVLAVGDGEFQKRCLGKVKELAQSGRTVLFVSHNLHAVSALCNKGFLLESGRLAHSGPIAEVIARYSHTARDERTSWLCPRPGNAPLYVHSVAIALQGRQPAHTLHLEVAIRSGGPHRACFAAFDISDNFGLVVMQAIPTLECFLTVREGETSFASQVELPPLIPGIYHVSIWLGPHNTETYDFVSEAVTFEVVESPTSGRTFPHSTSHGAIVPPSQVLSR